MESGRVCYCVYCVLAASHIFRAEMCSSTAQPVAATKKRLQRRGHRVSLFQKAAGWQVLLVVPKSFFSVASAGLSELCVKALITFFARHKEV